MKWIPGPPTGVGLRPKGVHVHAAPGRSRGGAGPDLPGSVWIGPDRDMKAPPGPGPCAHFHKNLPGPPARQAAASFRTHNRDAPVLPWHIPVMRAMRTPAKPRCLFAVPPASRAARCAAAAATSAAVRGALRG